MDKASGSYINLFRPDFTVAIGIAPIHACRLAGYTAGGETNPALRIYLRSV